MKGSGDSRRPLGAPHPPLILTTSMRQIVVSTSLGWETMTSEVANTFTSALSFCSVTDGGFGTWILIVSGRDSGYCWNTLGSGAGGDTRPESVGPWLAGVPGRLPVSP